MNLLLVGLGIAGVGLLAASKKKRPYEPIATAVTGDSGTLYAVTIGETGKDGRLLGVYNTDNQLLFTYIETVKGGRHFAGSAAGVEPGELAKALADFKLDD
jgi:hypothetical protein